MQWISNFQRLPECNSGMGGTRAHVDGHHCLHPPLHTCLPTLCLGIHHSQYGRRVRQTFEHPFIPSIWGNH